ncbi:MAG: hypothetical protein IT565_00145 [Rhodospirillales bacterium]|nr:hypothetical protein [Rhodospirillales bacterium]
MARWLGARGAALGAMALLLPACSLSNVGAEAPPGATAQARFETAQPPAAPPEAETAAIPAPGAESPAPAPNPEELVGLASREVAELLGFPQLRRRESPAELWQYANQSCILDLFFSKETEPARVAYVNLRSLNPVKMSRGQCMAELMPKPGRG